MTRKDHLVQLVAGLGSWTPDEGRVEHAKALLAEIERACPNATIVAASPGVEIYTQERFDEGVAKAVAAERERCAKIAESIPATCRKSRDEVDGICELVAAAIRRGGA